MKQQYERLVNDNFIKRTYIPNDAVFNFNDPSLGLDNFEKKMSFLNNNRLFFISFYRSISQNDLKTFFSQFNESIKKIGSNLTCQENQKTFIEILRQLTKFLVNTKEEKYWLYFNQLELLIDILYEIDNMQIIQQIQGLLLLFLKLRQTTQLIFIQQLTQEKKRKMIFYFYALAFCFFNQQKDFDIRGVSKCIQENQLSLQLGLHESFNRPVSEQMEKQEFDYLQLLRPNMVTVRFDQSSPQQTEGLIKGIRENLNIAIEEGSINHQIISLFNKYCFYLYGGDDQIQKGRIQLLMCSLLQSICAIGILQKSSEFCEEQQQVEKIFSYFGFPKQQSVQFEHLPFYLQQTYDDYFIYKESLVQVYKYAVIQGYLSHEHYEVYATQIYNMLRKVIQNGRGGEGVSIDEGFGISFQTTPDTILQLVRVANLILQNDMRQQQSYFNNFSPVFDLLIKLGYSYIQKLSISYDQQSIQLLIEINRMLVNEIDKSNGITFLEHFINFLNGSLHAYYQHKNVVKSVGIVQDNMTLMIMELLETIDSFFIEPLKTEFVFDIQKISKRLLESELFTDARFMELVREHPNFLIILNEFIVLFNDFLNEVPESSLPDIIKRYSESGFLSLVIEKFGLSNFNNEFDSLGFLVTLITKIHLYDKSFFSVEKLRLIFEHIVAQTIQKQVVINNYLRFNQADSQLAMRNFIDNLLQVVNVHHDMMDLISNALLDLFEHINNGNNQLSVLAQKANSDENMIKLLKEENGLILKKFGWFGEGLVEKEGLHEELLLWSKTVINSLKIFERLCDNHKSNVYERIFELFRERNNGQYFIECLADMYTKSWVYYDRSRFTKSITNIIRIGHKSNNRQFTDMSVNYSKESLIKFLNEFDNQTQKATHKDFKILNQLINVRQWQLLGNGPWVDFSEVSTRALELFTVYQKVNFIMQLIILLPQQIKQRELSGLLYENASYMFIVTHQADLKMVECREIVYKRNLLTEVENKQAEFYMQKLRQKEVNKKKFENQILYKMLNENRLSTNTELLFELLQKTILQQEMPAESLPNPYQPTVYYYLNQQILEESKKAAKVQSLFNIVPLYFILNSLVEFMQQTEIYNRQVLQMGQRAKQNKQYEMTHYLYKKNFFSQTLLKLLKTIIDILSKQHATIKDVYHSNQMGIMSKSDVYKLYIVDHIVSRIFTTIQKLMSNKVNRLNYQACLNVNDGQLLEENFNKLYYYELIQTLTNCFLCFEEVSGTLNDFLKLCSPNHLNEDRINYFEQRTLNKQIFYEGKLVLGRNDGFESFYNSSVSLFNTFITMYENFSLMKEELSKFEKAKKFTITSLTKGKKNAQEELAQYEEAIFNYRMQKLKKPSELSGYKRTLPVQFEKAIMKYNIYDWSKLSNEFVSGKLNLNQAYDKCVSGFKKLFQHFFNGYIKYSYLSDVIHNIWKLYINETVKQKKVSAKDIVKPMIFNIKQCIIQEVGNCQRIKELNKKASAAKQSQRTQVVHFLELLVSLIGLRDIESDHKLQLSSLTKTKMDDYAFLRTILQCQFEDKIPRKIKKSCAISVLNILRLCSQHGMENTQQYPLVLNDIVVQHNKSVQDKRQYIIDVNMYCDILNLFTQLLLKEKCKGQYPEVIVLLFQSILNVRIRECGNEDRMFIFIKMGYLFEAIVKSKEVLDFLLRQELKGFLESYKGQQVNTEQLENKLTKIFNGYKEEIQNVIKDLVDSNEGDNIVKIKESFVQEEWGNEQTEGSKQLLRIVMNDILRKLNESHNPVDQDDYASNVMCLSECLFCYILPRYPFYYKIGLSDNSRPFTIDFVLKACQINYKLVNCLSPLFFDSIIKEEKIINGKQSYVPINEKILQELIRVVIKLLEQSNQAIQQSGDQHLSFEDIESYRPIIDTVMNAQYILIYYMQSENWNKKMEESGEGVEAVEHFEKFATSLLQQKIIKQNQLANFLAYSELWRRRQVLQAMNKNSFDAIQQGTQSQKDLLMPMTFEKILEYMGEQIKSQNKQALIESTMNIKYEQLYMRNQTENKSHQYGEDMRDMDLFQDQSGNIRIFRPAFREDAMPNEINIFISDMQRPEDRDNQRSAIELNQSAQSTDLGVIRNTRNRAENISERDNDILLEVDDFWRSSRQGGLLARGGQPRAGNVIFHGNSNQIPLDRILMHLQNITGDLEGAQQDRLEDLPLSFRRIYRNDNNVRGQIGESNNLNIEQGNVIQGEDGDHSSSEEDEEEGMDDIQQEEEGEQNAEDYQFYEEEENGEDDESGEEESENDDSEESEEGSDDDLSEGNSDDMQTVEERLNSEDQSDQQFENELNWIDSQNESSSSSGDNEDDDSISDDDDQLIINSNNSLANNSDTHPLRSISSNAPLSHITHKTNQKGQLHKIMHYPFATPLNLSEKKFLFYYDPLMLALSKKLNFTLSLYQNKSKKGLFKYIESYFNKNPKFLFSYLNTAEQNVFDSKLKDCFKISQITQEQKKAQILQFDELKAKTNGLIEEAKQSLQAAIQQAEQLDNLQQQLQEQYYQQMQQAQQMRLQYQQLQEQRQQIISQESQQNGNELTEEQKRQQQERLNVLYQMQEKLEIQYKELIQEQQKQQQKLEKIYVEQGQQVEKVEQQLQGLQEQFQQLEYCRQQLYQIGNENSQQMPKLNYENDYVHLQQLIQKVKSQQTSIQLANAQYQEQIDLLQLNQLNQNDIILEEVVQPILDNVFQVTDHTTAQQEQQELQQEQQQLQQINNQVIQQQQQQQQDNSQIIQQQQQQQQEQQQQEQQQQEQQQQEQQQQEQQQQEQFNFIQLGLPENFLEIANIDETFFYALPQDIQYETIIQVGRDLNLLDESMPITTPGNQQPQQEQPQQNNSQNQENQSQTSAQQMMEAQNQNLLFLQSLGPELREEVLLTCPDEFLLSMPEQIQQEAVATRNNAIMSHYNDNIEQTQQNANLPTGIQKITQAIKKNRQRDIIKKTFTKENEEKTMKVNPGLQNFLLQMIVNKDENYKRQIVGYLTAIMFNPRVQEEIYDSLIKIAHNYDEEVVERVLSIIEVLTYSNFQYFIKKERVDTLLVMMSEYCQSSKLVTRFLRCVNHIIKTQLYYENKKESCELIITQTNLDHLASIIGCPLPDVSEQLSIILYLLAFNDSNLELIVSKLQENIARFAFGLNIKLQELLQNVDHQDWQSISDGLTPLIEGQNKLLKMFKLLDQLFKKCFQSVGVVEQREEGKQGGGMTTEARFNEAKEKVLLSFQQYFNQKNIKELFINTFKILNIFEDNLEKAINRLCVSKPSFYRILPLIEAFFIIYKILCDDDLLKQIKKTLKLIEQNAPDAKLSQLNEGRKIKMTKQSVEEAEKKVAQYNLDIFQLEGDIQELFDSVCAYNNKVLSYFLQVTPKLINSPLSIIIKKQPKMIPFDIKRKFFQQSVQQMKSKNQLRLIVRRDNLFADSFTQIQAKSGPELRGYLHIKFQDEEGEDAGGVQREWFSKLSNEMFNPNYVLFIPASHGYAYQPSPHSYVNREHLRYFNFIGKIVGRALFDGQLLDVHFTRSFYKHMVGRPLCCLDFEDHDPDYFASLRWISQNDISDLELTFCYEREMFGKKETIDLIPDGKNTQVMNDNKQDYVKMICEKKMADDIKPQLTNFLEGLYSVVPKGLLSIFDEKEIELMISGLPEIDIGDLKENTEYVNYMKDAQIIRWLWEILQSYDQSMRAGFLQFVTGTSKVPLEGFQFLKGINGNVQKFNIHKTYNTEKLPTAHTCMNQLDIPEYQTKEILYDKLTKAIQYGKEGFGFI